jgi:hypothetical protein
MSVDKTAKGVDEHRQHWAELSSHSSGSSCFNGEAPGYLEKVVVTLDAAMDRCKALLAAINGYTCLERDRRGRNRCPLFTAAGWQRTTFVTALCSI